MVTATSLPLRSISLSIGFGGHQVPPDEASVGLGSRIVAGAGLAFVALAYAWVQGIDAEIAVEWVLQPSLDAGKNPYVARALSSLLFGVQPTDLPTFLGGCALLAVLALVACGIPALRATRMDPSAVLRNE